MAELSLESLFLAHAAGETDKAGISRLELWIAAQTESASLDNSDVISELRGIISRSDMAVEGRWATTDYLIDRLGLRSEPLANTIEKAITTTEQVQAATAYDEFSAGLAFWHAGGALTPKLLTGQLGALRARASTHWLDLALIAFAGNDTALTKAIEDMVRDDLLRPQDIESRYRSIEAALRTSNFAVFFGRMVAASQSLAFRNHIVDWASKRHGVMLNDVSEIFQLVIYPDKIKDEDSKDIWASIRKLTLPAPQFARVISK
jgi:hypothetical protein